MADPSDIIADFLANGYPVTARHRKRAQALVAHMRANRFALRYKSDEEINAAQKKKDMYSLTVGPQRLLDADPE